MRPIFSLKIIFSLMVWSRCGDNGHGVRIMRRVQSLSQKTMVLGYALQKSPNGLVALPFVFCVRRDDEDGNENENENESDSQDRNPARNFFRHP